MVNHCEGYLYSKQLFFRFFCLSLFSINWFLPPSACFRRTLKERIHFMRAPHMSEYELQTINFTSQPIPVRQDVCNLL